MLSTDFSFGSGQGPHDKDTTSGAAGGCVAALKAAESVRKIMRNQTLVSNKQSSLKYLPNDIEDDEMGASALSLDISQSLVALTSFNNANNPFLATKRNASKLE